MFNTKKYLEKTSKILSKKILKIYQETIRNETFSVFNKYLNLPP